MFLLMLDAGLRVGEVVQLRISDLIFNSVPVTSIIISPEIAKNKTERTIPVSQRLSNALKNMNESFWSAADKFVNFWAFGNSLLNEDSDFVFDLIPEISCESIVDVPRVYTGDDGQVFGDEVAATELELVMLYVKTINSVGVWSYFCEKLCDCCEWMFFRVHDFPFQKRPAGGC
ncbi:hypothetical protein ES703_123536 [subsurface metagenome]